MNYLVTFTPQVNDGVVHNCEMSNRLTDLVTLSHSQFASEYFFYRLVDKDATVSKDTKVSYFKVDTKEVYVPATVSTDEFDLLVDSCQQFETLEELELSLSGTRPSETKGYKAILLDDSAIDAIELKEYHGF